LPRIRPAQSSRRGQPPDPADLPPGVYDELPAPAPPRRGYAWSRSPAAGAASPPL